MTIWPEARSMPLALPKVKRTRPAATSSRLALRTSRLRISIASESFCSESAMREIVTSRMGRDALDSVHLQP